MTEMTETCPCRALIGAVTIPVEEYRQLVEAAAIAEIRTGYEQKIITLTQELHGAQDNGNKWINSYYSLSHRFDDLQKDYDALKEANAELESRCRNLEWQEK